MSFEPQINTNEYRYYSRFISAHALSQGWEGDVRAATTGGLLVLPVAGMAVEIYKLCNF
jgi:hypothetical protein